MWLAKQKCPDLVFVPPNFNLYVQYSEMAKKIYSDYTNKVEAFGIDECWLDVTGSTSLFGNGQTIADTIRERILKELGITASIGVSFNKVFAKLGSDLNKPNATTIITEENFKDIVWRLPVNELLYVGRKTQNKLKQVGIKTIGDLANFDVELLQSILGKWGYTLWTFANGWDISPVTNIGAKSFIKSIGNSTTTPRDLITNNDVKIILYKLCESVATRLREHDFKCRTVQITIRDTNLKLYERQKKLSLACSNSKGLFNEVFELFCKNHIPFIPVRSLGVRATNLFIEKHTQLSLFNEQVISQRQDILEETIDNIRKKFGHFSIQRGIMLTDKVLSNINPKDEHYIYPVSFFKDKI